uniref:tRNA-uridine aminocarboxypropyltransferase n=1 Tax=Gorilla gorilla gorilla TaxID=9595 RepID=A0A2I2Z1K0_GORGO
MSLNPPIFLKRSEENNSNFVETKQSQTTSIASEDPLQNSCLASQEVLQKAQQSGRSKCLKCGGSRMFYCSTYGKSTAIHAKLLAPEFANIYTYSCIPEYEEKDHEVALVFPGPQSISIKDISFHLQKRIQNNVSSKNDDPDKSSFKRKRTEEQAFCDLNDSKCKGTTLKKIIFIDSTWNQTNKIFTDERLQGKKKKKYFFGLLLPQTYFEKTSNLQII